jgi:hypothetical protein
VPPRPHPLVLAALAFGTLVVMALVMPRGAGGADRWHRPLRGPVLGAFHVSRAAPFARGQRRGIDLSGAPGAVVRAACPGRVTFAGLLPRRGGRALAARGGHELAARGARAFTARGGRELAVSVRCGALVATYLGLGRLAVRAGSEVGAGSPLGTLGPTGRLRLGARRASERRGYLDPLMLLAADAPTLPRLGPAPRGVRRHRLPPTRPAPRPIAPAMPPAPGPAGAPRRLPWLAYPALALVASTLPLGGLVHRRRRRTRLAGAAAASHLR